MIQYNLNENALDQLKKTIRKVNNIKGVGCIVTHANDNIVIQVPQPAPQRAKPTVADDPVLFPVLIKSNGGADGNATTFATWAYDLYDLTDEGYTEKLNDSPLQPVRSAARIIEGKVTKPSDGSVGMAYVDAAGDIQLWDLPETRSKFACT